jgi:hypothetical protein
MATPNVSSDIGQFFDFGEAALAGTHQETVASVDPAPKSTATYCPAHGNDSTDG